MKKCQKIQTELSAYIDNELPIATQALVEEHVQGCRDCRERLTELEKLTSGVKALARSQPGPELLAGVRHRIAQGTRAPLHDWQHLLFRPYWLKIPMEAVAVILVVSFAIRVERSINERTPGHEEVVMRTEKPASAPVASGGESRLINKLAPNRPVGIPAPSASGLTAGLQTESPAEVIVIYAKDFDDVQSQVHHLAADLNGRILPPPDGKATMHTLFVELPPENENSFKTRLFQATRPVNGEAQSHFMAGSNSISQVVGGLAKKAGSIVLEIQMAPPRD
jgi:hypothetical protein